MFIHLKVRLFCELIRTEQWLTTADKMKCWLDGDVDSLKVIEVTRREKVTAVWADLSEDLDRQDRIEFHLMNCADRTLYCSEVHLMVYPDASRQLKASSPECEQWRSENKASWEARLEKLRKCINKDWVIEDRDLTRSILKGSRL